MTSHWIGIDLIQCIFQTREYKTCRHLFAIWCESKVNWFHCLRCMFFFLYPLLVQNFRWTYALHPKGLNFETSFFIPYNRIIVHMVSYLDDIWKWHFGNSFHGWGQRTNTFQPSQTQPSVIANRSTDLMPASPRPAMACMVWRNSSWHLCQWRILESHGTCFHLQNLSWQQAAKKIPEDLLFQHTIA